uniref:Uncharacterized protein n=1 Tax=Proboscia inermis TaxID=420281 RepID=A0A7S0GJL4_9STRA
MGTGNSSWIGNAISVSILVGGQAFLTMFEFEVHFAYNDCYQSLFCVCSQNDPNLDFETVTHPSFKMTNTHNSKTPKLVLIVIEGCVSRASHKSHTIRHIRPCSGSSVFPVVPSPIDNHATAS